MSGMVKIDDVACGPSPARKLKITFVADQFSPPVFDGSTFVYKSWIDFLSEAYELYAIVFDSYGGDANAAESAARYLAERCEAHLLLPGPSRNRLWRVLRAASRFVTGTVFAPRWVEEFGRADIHRTIANFIDRHNLSFFLVSKLASVPLFGEKTLHRGGAVFFLDTHDDFVLREHRDREVLAELMLRFPQLRDHRRFRDMRLRQLLSRLVLRRARAQEARLCALFDCVLTSSLREHSFYESSLAGIVPCVHLGWPPPLPSSIAYAPNVPTATPLFDAGFIGGESPFNVEAVLFFCREVLPLIREHRPGFKFLIAGGIGAPLACIGSTWPGVEVCGYLPDARSFYQQVRLVVVPLLSGTGVSIKTQEALDSGKHVVSTSVGARGLASCRGHTRLSIADKAEDFARQVLALCEQSYDPKRQRSFRSQSTSTGVSRIMFQSAFEDLARRFGRYDELLT
jgi:hypothetical protein